MRRFIALMAAGIVLGTFAAGTAEAGDRRQKRGRAQVRQESRWDDRRDYRPAARRDAYFRGRDVVVIRDYYRPYYRPLPPGLQKKYNRSGYLPPGWARRVRPLPVYVERDMVRVPRGYYRGVIDGRAVVYNDRGFILDVAVLF